MKRFRLLKSDLQSKFLQFYSVYKKKIHELLFTFSKSFPDLFMTCLTPKKILQNLVRFRNLMKNSSKYCKILSTYIFLKNDFIFTCNQMLLTQRYPPTIPPTPRIKKKCLTTFKEFAQNNFLGWKWIHAYLKCLENKEYKPPMWSFLQGYIFFKKAAMGGGNKNRTLG